MTASIRSEDRGPGLRLAQDVALAALLQVDPGQLEAVERGGHGAQPGAGRARLAGLRDQEAQARRGTPPDASAQLVQLRDAEPVGVHDHHDRGVGDVHPDLDHRGRDQHVHLAGGEPPHDVVLGLRLHPAVQHLDAQPGQRALRQLPGDVQDGQRWPLLVPVGVALGRLLLLVADARADHVRLVAALDLLAHPLPGPGQEVRLVLGGHHMGGDGGAAGGELVQDGRLQVAEDGHGDRARDGGRGHHQQVRRLLALGAERVALLDAEAVLLVHHDQAEVVELHLVLDQGVGADDDPGLAGDEVQQGLPPGRRAHGAGEQHHLGAPGRRRRACLLRRGRPSSR
ncbi:hypothetical protein GCM10020221_33680 [Streptomyces thioluteus]|uniref:Uncharacterized protein n=1 Tax=Streptomyces thioluteus TaxID=66431 RepID=A0ABN3X221_STRTU